MNIRITTMAINIKGVLTDQLNNVAGVVSNAISSKLRTPYTMYDVQGLAAPAQDWHYRVVLPQFPKVLNTPSSNISGWGSKLIKETSDMGLFVQGIDIPQVTVSSNPRKYSGRDLNFPGRVNVQSFSIQFYEDRNYNVTNYLNLWKQAIVNDNGDYGLPVQYKKPIRVYSYDEDGFKRILFSMWECYPETTQGYSYSSANSGRIVLSASFSCDWVSIQRLNDTLRKATDFRSWFS